MRPQGLDQRAALVVDRAAPAEVVVVFGDFLEPGPRDVAPARHALEERHHVFGLFWPPETEQQKGVVLRHRLLTRMHAGGGAAHAYERIQGKRCREGISSEGRRCC
jgi:hypothetical protein